MKRMLKTAAYAVLTLIALALVYNAGSDATNYVLGQRVGKQVAIEMQKAAKEQGVDDPYIHVRGCFYSDDTWWCDVQAGLDEENSTRFALPVE